MPPFGQAVATAACLTEEQVAAARKLYGGPVSADGEALYPGHQAIGSELGWSGWMTGMAYGIGRDYLRYLAFAQSDPTYDLHDWTFDVASFDSLRPLGEVYNATNSDLSAFASRGGKLILYHGWADPAISPFGTLAYYQAVVDTVGDLGETQEFARLFMVPGMFHCSGGNAPNTFDLLGPIQDWVENGVAPEQIIATEYAGSGQSGGFANPTAGGANQGDVVRTRPLCPFPLEQTYAGSGNVDDAASFTCALSDDETLTSGAYEWVGSDLFVPPSGSSD
jgi:feruloyl esterase